MGEYDAQVDSFWATKMIAVVDGFMAELGTQGLIDGDKARNQLMDLRLMLMELLQSSDPPPAELVPDPALFTEIIAPF